MVIADAARVSAPHSAAPLRYTGGRGRLFRIALAQMTLTILTLGLWRFWMTSRLRRHYWSSTSVDGAPFEYTGTAAEKLLGFLMALVVLALYLMAANLALTFVGLSLFPGNLSALQAPLLALAPLWFWAQYRARRYLLARTRWRGIRFALLPGAWGYAWRTTALWLLTICTAGFLYPFQQMTLARYVTNRVRFGDLAFEQRGGWGALLKSWLWFWIPAMLTLVGLGAGVAAGAAELRTHEGDVADAVPPAAALLALLASFALAVALVRHRVFAFRYLWSNKTIDGSAGFEATLRTGPVIAIYAGGALMIAAGVALASIAAIALLGLGVAFLSGIDMSAVKEATAGRFDDITASLVGLATLLAYLPAVAVFVALGHAFISHPLLKEIAATTRIFGLDAVARARQRPRDEQAEAGGFADALGADIGGAM